MSKSLPDLDVTSGIAASRNYRLDVHVSMSGGEITSSEDLRYYRYYKLESIFCEKKIKLVKSTVVWC